MADITGRRITMVKSALREAIAISFWVYAILKLFVFDVDLYIANHITSRIHGLIAFKLPLLLGGAAISWIILGGKNFGLALLYLMGYPFIIAFWKFPKMLLRNWSMMIIFTPVLFEVVTAIKMYFISYSVAVIAAICIIESGNVYLLSLSMALLFILLALHLGLSLTHAYKSSVFTKISKGLVALKTELANV